jgi:uncharacterized membrane protein YgdD (TMEM256/DUF423 family)
MDNGKIFLKAGAILGALAVSIGAFGAHLFKQYLASISRLATFETAVQYQFYGAFFLIFLGIMPKAYWNKYAKWAGNSMLAGTLIFSIALYLICLTNKNIFGAIAPIGGLGMIFGWLLLFYSSTKLMD